MSASLSPNAASAARGGASAKVLVVTILVGLGAGLGGMAMALLLHMIQHFAYGYSLDHLVGDESFLDGVSAASDLRRVVVLAVGGVVAGCGWWAVYRFGRPLVSIRDAVKANDPRMPVGSTLGHALLQIITVALGSPLGREVAPREIGSLWAGWLSHWAGLSPEQSRLMVACGAGAGLAAVYNVPLGGAVFVLEVLLGSFSLPMAAAALATSSIAAVVGWIGLGDESQYQIPQFALSGGLVAWALVCGPLFGVAAYAFTRLTTQARAGAPRGWRLPLQSLLNFLVIGGFAMYFPQLLGNGKGPAQLAFDSSVTMGLAAILLVLKVALQASTLRAGAEGGLLTPGLSDGALLAIVLGGVWNMVLPGVPLGAFALIGAAAFLASSMKMPLTAIVLMAEFTHLDQDFLVPMLLAVAGSICASRWCEQRASVQRRAPIAKPNTGGVGVPQA